jgi:hypothetical protein
MSGLLEFGVGQSAGLSKMAGTAFENEMMRGREI